MMIILMMMVVTKYLILASYFYCFLHVFVPEFVHCHCRVFHLGSHLDGLVCMMMMMKMMTDGGELAIVVMTSYTICRSSYV